MRESSPLKWPEGLPRTQIRDREERKAWKKTEKQSIAALDNELHKFNVLSWTLTRQDPDDFRSAPDPSIAVYFSRKREDDFSWQSALRISNPAPTREEIETAFRKLAAPYHPDRDTRDLELFLALDKHKQNALAYVKRLTGQASDLAIACDLFKESRWNITAIANTIRSFRQMERDGTSKLLERALVGFQALTEGTPERETVRVNQTVA
jgi:hypothetical protein